jgi:large subunit ribosomal protein L22
MIVELEKVPTLKRIIPMFGEIPHRKGKIHTGRYPIKASKVFVKLLKNLRANAQNVGMDSEDLIIKTAIANKASRPRHFSGRWSGKRKRSHVELAACEKIISVKSKNKAGERKK